jgi:VWFA-related protein
VRLHALAVVLALQATMPRVDEIIEVRLINFDVVVTDADGNHVRGLTRDDFELVENGERQQISNLSEIHLDPTAPAGDPVPPRRIVVFVDALSTDTFARKRACRAMAAFLARELHPGDDATVVLWNRTLTTLVPATNDAERLAAGLRKAAEQVSAGRLPALLRERGGTEARVRERMYRNIHRQELVATARAVNGVLSNLAGTDGRKALVLITEGMSISPGRDAQELADLGPIDPDDALAMSTVSDIAQTANAAGVPLYLIHAPGLESGMSVEDTSPSAALRRVQYGASDSSQGLLYLANRTGGIAAVNSNEFKDALVRISRDLSSYYSLGYRVQARRVDRERNVTIRTRDPRHHVRARRSFMERSFEREVADTVLSSLFFPGRMNQLGIAVVTGTVVRQGGKRLKVPVDVKIPLAALTFEPYGDGFAADVTVFIAAADPQGAASSVEQFRRRIPITREGLSTLTGKHYTYGLDVDLRAESRDNRFAVAVLDNVSKMTGVATADVKKK